MAQAEYIVEIRIPWYARAAMKLGAWLVFLGRRVFSWGSEKTRIVPE